jgi:hypothetical protein
LIIHLLRTLCRDEPPEAAELLDYFDSTYISGRLRQQNPAQNQAVRLVLRRSPPMFPPAIWNVHDAHTYIEYFQFKIVNVHNVNCLLSTIIGD